MSTDRSRARQPQAQESADTKGREGANQKASQMATDPSGAPLGGSIKQVRTYGALRPDNSKLDHPLGSFGQLDLSARPHLAKAKESALERLAERVPCLGILLALAASLFLGTAGMLVKMTHSVHGIQVAVFRALIQLLVYIVLIAFKRLPMVPPRSELLACGSRAVFGAISITFSYFALKLIPLGDATTIRFSLPIWTLIISYLLLGESCNLLKVCAVIVSVLGVVLIAKPDDCLYVLHLLLRTLRLESADELAIHYQELQEAHSHADLELATDGIELLAGSTTTTTEMAPIVGSVQSINQVQQFEGCLMALTSSICLSFSLIALRLCKRTPAEVTIFWLSLASIVIGTLTLIALNEWRLPNNLHDVLYILLNGLCGSIGQWFITSAMKVEQSGVIALARTFDIEVAFLYSALLLHETIRATSVVGSILVSSGVVVVVIPKWLSSRNSAQNGSEASSTDDSSSKCDSEEEARPPVAGLTGANGGPLPAKR